MSEQANEMREATIADIVAALRKCSDEWIGDRSMVYMEGAGCFASYLADLIEAAWKRERDECRMLAATTIVTEKVPVGNAAAMREALVRVLLLANVTADGENWDWNNAIAENVVNVVKAALSAPPRNCDRHGGWLTALKRFNDTDGRNNPWGDDVFNSSFLDWLFAPATEGGEK